MDKDTLTKERRVAAFNAPYPPEPEEFAGGSEELLRVLALTFGEADQGSSHYRIYEFIEPLRAHGIELTACPAKRFAQWGELGAYDAVIIQKRLFPVGKIRRLRRRARRLVYDIDDAIWQPHGKCAHFWYTNWRTRLRLKTTVTRADLCLAANPVLARHLAQWSANVAVHPMALSEIRWRPRVPAADFKPLRVGWAGSPVNLFYLEALEPSLTLVQREHPEVEFAVFCGQCPGFHELKFDYIPYQAGMEPEVIRRFDLGLLPLEASAFAEAKSPIKALQYMACGLPAVVSPVGATRQLFRAGETGLFASTPVEWTQALRLLLRDEDLRRELGREARREFEANYGLTRAAARLAAWLWRAAGKPHQATSASLGLPGKAAAA